MGKSIIRKSEALSPLRYPGGKALLVPYISGVIEENYLGGCTFFEPYAGGSSVSLELLRLGFISNAVLVEKDPLVFAFWWSVFNSTDELCAAVAACPVTIDTWNELQPTKLVLDPFSSDYSLLQLGTAGLFFNRTNFSGIMGAGPIGGALQKSAYKINCRFNSVKLIRQIRAASEFSNRVQLHFGDALTFLRKNTHVISSGFSFVYIDPPYYVQGSKLYRFSYKDQDHVALATFIREQGYPWLLSYDDHPRIRELYENTQVQPIYLDYKVRSSKTAQELLISNLQIPPPVYTEAILPPELIEIAA